MTTLGDAETDTARTVDGEAKSAFVAMDWDVLYRIAAVQKWRVGSIVFFVCPWHIDTRAVSL